MVKQFDLKKGAYSALVILIGIVWVNLFGNRHVVFTILIGISLFSYFDIKAPLLHRVGELSITAILCTILTPLAILSGNSLPTAIIFTFLAVFISSMTLALGAQSTKIGFLMTAWLMVALSMPGDTAAAISTTLSLLTGWLIYLSYVLLMRNSAYSDSDFLEMMTFSQLENIGVRLKEHLVFKSPILQFALLRSLATALALFIGWSIFRNSPFWMAYAVFFVIRPGLDYSIKPGLQRAAGTLIGAVLAYFTVLFFPGNSMMLQFCFLVSLSGCIAEGGRQDGLFIGLFTYSLLIYFTISGADISEVAPRRVIAYLLGIILALVTIASLKYLPNTSPSNNS